MNDYDMADNLQKRVKNQRNEIARLHKCIDGLTQSRNVWKSRAEQIGKQLFEVLAERKKGEWKEANTLQRSHQFICSACGKIAYFPQPTRLKDWKKHCPYKYCPNCGAKMKGD